MKNWILEITKRTNNEVRSLKVKSDKATFMLMQNMNVVERRSAHLGKRGWTHLNDTIKKSFTEIRKPLNKGEASVWELKVTIDGEFTKQTHIIPTGSETLSIKDFFYDLIANTRLI